MELEFKSKNEKQLLACEKWLDETTEQILYGGAKGGGKSFLGCSMIFADALIYPETHYFIARAELNDLRKYTIPSIYEVFAKWGLKVEDHMSFNGQDSVFNLKNGSKVFLLSCKATPQDPLFERFGSMQNTRGWIEEGGEVPENAKDNLWLSIGRWKNDVYGLKKKLLITANPKKGWMKREFVDPAKEGTLAPSKAYIQAFATDNKYLAKDYIETLNSQKNVVARQRLFLGMWDYDDSKDSIVSTDALSDMRTNTVTNSNEMFLVIDVARFGKDFTTFEFWRGYRMFRVVKKSKQSIEETKRQAKEYAVEYGIPYSHVIADEDGVGGGLVDGMIGIRGFVANSTPLPTASEIRKKSGQLAPSEFVPKNNFANLKSQCGWKLAEMINEHKLAVDLDDSEIFDEIVQDLEATLKVKEVDNDKKLQLKSKEDIKKEIGRSPDLGDGLIMRMWFELRNEAIDEDPNLEKKISMQKDQFRINMGKNRSNR
jgi:phage terminase large subunit